MDVRDFRRLLRRFEQVTSSQANLCCLGVSVAQCHALLEIEHLGAATIGGLADALGLDKSTLSRTVDGLVREGLVDRAPDPEDRRYANVTLTARGRQTCEAINDVNDAFYLRILESVPESRRREAAEVIQLFVEAAQQELSGMEHSDGR